jgi:hypothetical protein
VHRQAPEVCLEVCLVVFLEHKVFRVELVDFQVLEQVPHKEAIRVHRLMKLIETDYF